MKIDDHTIHWMVEEDKTWLSRKPFVFFYISTHYYTSIRNQNKIEYKIYQAKKILLSLCVGISHYFQKLIFFLSLFLKKFFVLQSFTYFVQQYKTGRSESAFIFSQLRFYCCEDQFLSLAEIVIVIEWFIIEKGVANFSNRTYLK